MESWCSLFSFYPHSVLQVNLEIARFTLLVYYIGIYRCRVPSWTSCRVAKPFVFIVCALQIFLYLPILCFTHVVLKLFIVKSFNFLEISVFIKKKYCKNIELS